MNLGPERANGPVGCGHGHAPSIAPSEHKLTARRGTATGHYSLPRSPIHIHIHIYTLILFYPPPLVLFNPFSASWDRVGQRARSLRSVPCQGDVYGF